MQRSKFILYFLFVQNLLCLNAQSIKEKLAAIPGITFSSISSDLSNDRYEVYVEQALDHNDPSTKKFRQRVIIDFKSEDSSTVMDTDGYGINYALMPMYQHELATLLNANLVIIEHRFFGHSLPDTLNYDLLTTAQAAADIHFIRTLFAGIFPQKWISTGISKGGQAALAHKINYPEDVSSVVVYGTAVKKKQIENKIDSMLTDLSQTECGRKLLLFQNNLMNNKATVLPYLNDFVFKNGVTFTKLDKETVFDYMVLELPFSFWQTGIDCSKMPLTAKDPFEMFKFLSTVISPSFYSDKTLKRLEPSFYMSYHELGFYEYKTKRYKGFLKQKDYSNKTFAPKNIKINFDKTYLNKLSAFLKTKEAEKIIFIYGEKDPWSSMQSTGKAEKFIIKNGSHKSRIADMGPEQKKGLLNALRKSVN
jgi:pimeloyl-ACP methyl ester carboxylesterase